MNMIFKKLSNLIKKCKVIFNETERKKLEDDVNCLVEQCIKDYPSFSKKYTKINKEQLDLKDDNMKTIITE